MTHIRDWLDHLRVQPDENGLYPHPGMWLTQDDDSDHALIRGIQAFDATVLSKLLCATGHHRWITVWHREQQPRTACWYCEKQKEDPFAYRQARGAIKRPAGSPEPEDAIRKARDA